METREGTASHPGANPLRREVSCEKLQPQMHKRPLGNLEMVGRAEIPEITHSVENCQLSLVLEGQRGPS